MSILPWANSTRLRQERLGDLALLGGVAEAAAVTSFSSLQWWWILIVWGVCLLPALVCSRLGWLRLFGPVLYYDMIRQGRRSRFILLRFLFVMALVFVLAVIVKP